MNVLILFILFSAAVYFPCAAFPYIFHDDLLFFVKASSGIAPFALWDSVASHGRGIAAILISVVGWFVNDLCDLQVLRGLSIILVGVWAWRWFLVFSRLWGARLFTLLAAMLLITFPATGIIASRACDVLFPLAWLLSMYAAAFANTGSSKSFLFKGSNSRCWVGGLMLAAAYSIHQSAAGMFWPYALVVWLASRRDKMDLKGLKPFALAGGAGIIIYAIKVVIIARLLSPDLRHGIYNPMVIVEDPLNRLAWFITEPLSNVLNFWHLAPAVPWIGASLFILALIGFARRYGSRALGVAALVMLLSFLPNLLAKGEAGFYRCLTPLTVCVVIIFVGALAGLQERCSKPLTVLLAVLLLGGGIAEMNNVYREKVLPGVAETAYTERIARSLSGPRWERWHVFRRSVPAEARYDEWGKISTDYPHDTFLLSTYLTRRGVIAKTPSYASSQSPEGQIDYFVIETQSTRRMGKSVLRETGSQRFLPGMKHRINTPDVRQYRWQGSLYFFALIGPPVDPKQTVFFNMKDLQ